MVDSIAADLASSTACGRHLRHQARRPSPLSVCQDAHLEPAGSVPPTTGEDEEVPDIESGSKRGRADEVAIGDRSAATASTDRQGADAMM